MITEEDKKEMFLQHTSGIPMGKIAKNFKTSRQTVWYHLTKMGIPRRETMEEREEKASQFLRTQRNPNVADVAKHIGCSVALAKKILRNLGKGVTKKPFASTVERNQLITLYVIEDKSLAEMSALFGISEMTVSSTLADMGIPIRPRGASSGDRRIEWRKKAIEDLNLA